MNHDLNNPSAGQAAPPVSGRDEMQSAVARVKDLYGVYYAKALIEASGVRRMAEMVPEHYATTGAVAAKMNEQNYDTHEGKRAALELLVGHIGKMVDHWFGSDNHSIKIVLREWEDAGGTSPVPGTGAGTAPTEKTMRPHPVMAAKLSPNDIIACLLEIAFKAQRVVAHGVSNADGEALRDYHALADSFSPLQQLTVGDYDTTPVQRAKLALASFIEGASVTIAGKEALEGIMAAMDAAVPGVRMGPILNEVFAVRSYEDTYVHSLVDALADISTDGRRFRTLMWMMKMGHEFEALEIPLEGDETEPKLSAEEEAYFADYKRAEAIMDGCNPESLDDMRAALDAVSMLGVVPDMPSHFFNLSGAYDKLHGTALGIAAAVANNYHVLNAPNSGRKAFRCIHCGNDMPPDDTLSEKHRDTCVVLTARQLIEDAQ
jgi:hypothetical protein